MEQKERIARIVRRAMHGNSEPGPAPDDLWESSSEDEQADAMNIAEHVIAGMRSITSYAQIEAIHEAMRECEELGPATYNDRDGYECATFDDVDVRKCFAKIRAALAGETPEESDERMVRPEDVAPPVVERDNEDSKTTWQG